MDERAALTGEEILLFPQLHRVVSIPHPPEPRLHRIETSQRNRPTTSRPTPRWLFNITLARRMLVLSTWAAAMPQPDAYSPSAWNAAPMKPAWLPPSKIAAP